MTALEAQQAQQQRLQLAHAPPAASGLELAPLSKVRMLLEGTRVRRTAFMVSRTSTRAREDSTWHDRVAEAGAADRNCSSKSLVMKPTAWEALLPPRYSGKVAARSLVAIMVSKRSFLFSSRKMGVRAKAGFLRPGAAGTARGGDSWGAVRTSPTRRRSDAASQGGRDGRWGGASEGRAIDLRTSGRCAAGAALRGAHATTSAKRESDSRILLVEASS